MQDPCVEGLAGTPSPQHTYRGTVAPCCPAFALQCSTSFCTAGASQLQTDLLADVTLHPNSNPIGAEHAEKQNLQI